MKRMLALVLLVTTMAAGGALLTGCSWSIGGGSKGGDTHPQATRGQELIDLKRALDSGAITQQEYQAQKDRIMNK
jgi:hypothetical protein